LQISQSPRGIFRNQSKYALETSDPVDTPMYSKDSCIALTAFADADHAGCQDIRKSTPRSMQLLGNRLEQVENGVVELYVVRTEYQLADIFTKALGRERLEFLINKLGMISMSPKTLKNLAQEKDE
ncbi:hypothetical protein Tco_1515329, partial [Tanacetum coccineum]